MDVPLPITLSLGEAPKKLILLKMIMIPVRLLRAVTKLMLRLVDIDKKN